MIIMLPPSVSSEEEWVVNDIRISGLQRVSAGSVFNVMPIAVGDTVDMFDLQNTAKTIFKTGQFDDIQIGREGNTLIISIVERPSIASIELDGNITTQAVTKIIFMYSQIVLFSTFKVFESSFNNI